MIDRYSRIVDRYNEILWIAKTFRYNGSVYIYNKTLDHCKGIVDCYNEIDDRYK